MNWKLIGQWLGIYVAATLLILWIGTSIAFAVIAGLGITAAAFFLTGKKLSDLSGQGTTPAAVTTPATPPRPRNRNRNTWLANQAWASEIHAAARQIWEYVMSLFRNVLKVTAIILGILAAVLAISLDPLYGPLGIILVLLIIAAIYFVPIALSTVYAFRGRIENDRFMITLKNTSFHDIHLYSRTATFFGGDDPVKRWDISDTKKADDMDVPMTYNIGFWPVYKAMRVVIPINAIKVQRPKQVGDNLVYKIPTVPIVTYTPPRFLTHGFETAKINTRSGKVSHHTDIELVAELTETLQVEIEITNPYLAFLRIPRETGQGFMLHLNGILQSTAREVTAQFSYIDIIMAKVEDDRGDTHAGSEEAKLAKATKPEVKSAVRKLYGKMFKAVANKGLRKIGVRIINVDMLDHSLDPKMSGAVQKAQVAAYEAGATIITAKAEKEGRELLAKGDAAELKEILEAANGDTVLAGIEVQRRGLQRAAEGVGKNFAGQFLTVNFGGNSGGAVGPQPAITVGSLDQKKEEKKNGNRPHKRGDKKDDKKK